tara:strand:+ start:9018 stop:10373 length:1356 start_codon:yes stop_codon:yes gene_type:complete
MNNMEVELRGTVVDVRFPDARIHIRANRIRESAEKATAEITVWADLAIGDNYRKVRLNRSRPDLLDNNDKRNLIRDLEEATIDYPNYSWGSIINNTFDAIIDKNREGYSEVVMDDLKKAKGRSFAIKPLWEQNVNNLLWAKGGSSKSYFALLSCVFVDRGIKSLGLTAKPGRALYLDWEEEEDIFRHRLYSVQKGLNVENPERSNIVWKQMRGSLPANIEEISRLVIDNDISFVVIDSVGLALGGSGVDDEAVKGYFEALKLLKVTTLSVDHANKSGERTGNYEIFGSTYKYSYARNVYELKKVTEENAQEFESVFYHRKVNDGKLLSPTGFKVTFEETREWNPDEAEYEMVLDKVVFESLGLADASIEHLKGLTISALCYELIKKSEEKGTILTTDELARDIGFIKNEGEGSVSIDVIERTLNNSTTMQLNQDGTVQLISKQEEETEWTV